MTQNLQQYIQTHRIECISEPNAKFVLLKTQSSYIYNKDATSTLSDIARTLPLKSCPQQEILNWRDQSYLKYQSIDDVHGSGNHFIFWFTPEGFDVYEIQQLGNKKQFKLPLDEGHIYHIRNDLIVLHDETAYIIPVS